MRRRVLVVVFLSTLALAGWSFSRGAQVSDPEVAKGIRHVEQADFDAAVVTLDAASRRLAVQAPESKDLPQAFLYLGIAYLGKGDEVSAKARFREVLARVKDMKLGPDRFTPRVIQVFEQARAESKAQSAAQTETLVLVGPGGQQIRVGDDSVTVAQGGQTVTVGDRAPQKGERGAAQGGTQGPAGPAGSANRQRRTEPVRCGPADEVRLSGVLLEVPGDAVIVEGGCELEIVDCEIVAGGWGIVAHSGAEIVIRNSMIGGGRGALDLREAAEVSASSSTFRGRVSRRETSDFIDLGGNRFE